MVIPKDTRTTQNGEPAKTTSATEILDRLDGEDPSLERLIDDEDFAARVAQLAYDARMASGLSQEELARRAGVEPSMIAQLEDADYPGNALPLLQRIASALGKCIDLRLIDQERRTA